MKISPKIIVTGSLVLLAGFGCQTAPDYNLKDVQGENAYFAQNTARIEVKNQTKGSELVVPLVVASQDSWVVLRADKSGVPGEVLGYTAVASGEHKDVKVAVDSGKVTPVVHVNLYVDLGTKGKFENPGSDIPVTANDVGISGSFMVQ